MEIRLTQPESESQIVLAALCSVLLIRRQVKLFNGELQRLQHCVVYDVDDLSQPRSPVERSSKSAANLLSHLINFRSRRIINCEKKPVYLMNVALICTSSLSHEPPDSQLPGESK